jgi:hypothetical protein
LITPELVIPRLLSDRGDIAGDYFDSSNVRRGLVRFGNGSFSAPIVEPGDTGNFKRARGINNHRTIVGVNKSGETRKPRRLFAY